MTEEEWLACNDRQPMLEAFRGQFSDRKLRLFACACCRRIWHLLGEQSQDAVIVAEYFADGIASTNELAEAHEQAFLAATSPEGEAAWWATAPDAFDAGFEASYTAAGREAILGWPGRNDNDPQQCAREHAEAADLLRDIIGNPFRPVVGDPSWLTSTVLDLARGIYDERAFDRLPILADALQDAGCDNADVLDHCRGSGSHVRGCWVVDLLLGKS